MQAKRTYKSAAQGDLFRVRLEQILADSRNHPLYLLAEQIQWSVFEE